MPAVLLQPLKEFPDGMVCKDKFQVLSIPVKPAEKKEDVKIYVRAAAFAEPPIRTFGGRTSACHAVGHHYRQRREGYSIARQSRSRNYSAEAQVLIQDGIIRTGISCARHITAGPLRFAKVRSSAV